MGRLSGTLDALRRAGEIVQATVRRLGDPDIPATDYRGGHTAPVDPEYHAPLHDLTKTYPDDIYSQNAARYYGHGDPSLDKESFDIINRVRGNPDAAVTMYRAVPADAPDAINPGDWVTTNLRYAREHGEGFEDYKILTGETNAGRLRTDGNSPHEYGYTGFATPAALVATAGITGSGMAIHDFQSRRASKSDQWKQRKAELYSLINDTAAAIGGALDKPLQGYMGLAGVAGTLAAGGTLPQALQQGARIAAQPSDVTAYQYGGAMTDALAPYSPQGAAIAGALTNAGIQLTSPL